MFWALAAMVLLAAAAAWYVRRQMAATASVVEQVAGGQPSRYSVDLSAAQGFLQLKAKLEAAQPDAPATSSEAGGEDGDGDGLRRRGAGLEDEKAAPPKPPSGPDAVVTLAGGLRARVADVRQLQRALLFRAMAFIEQAQRYRRHVNEINGAMRAGLLPEADLAAFKRGEAELEEEFKQIPVEANEIAAGWGDGVFKQAQQIYEAEMKKAQQQAMQAQAARQQQMAAQQKEAELKRAAVEKKQRAEAEARRAQKNFESLLEAEKKQAKPRSKKAE